MEAESPELKAAYERMVKAVEEYGRLAPKRPEPTEPPTIEPVRMWASPSNFHRGYNMHLDCWTAPHAGKIPVLVVPLTPECVRACYYAMMGKSKNYEKLKAIGIEPVKP